MNELRLIRLALALGKVYDFGPTFRAEKSKTRRHLTEFWMVEPEVAYATLDDVIEKRAYFQFYMHRTGHWLGMDVHDCGAYTEPSEIGQTSVRKDALTGDTIVNAGTLALARPAPFINIVGPLVVNANGTVRWDVVDGVADASTTWHPQIDARNTAMSRAL